jgi:hypothetical protein
MRSSGVEPSQSQSGEGSWPDRMTRDVTVDFLIAGPSTRFVHLTTAHPEPFKSRPRPWAPGPSPSAGGAPRPAAALAHSHGGTVKRTCILTVAHGGRLRHRDRAPHLVGATARGLRGGQARCARTLDIVVVPLVPHPRQGPESLRHAPLPHRAACHHPPREMGNRRPRARGWGRAACGRPDPALVVALLGHVIGVRLERGIDDWRSVQRFTPASLVDSRLPAGSRVRLDGAAARAPSSRCVSLFQGRRGSCC